MINNPTRQTEYPLLFLFIENGHVYQSMTAEGPVSITDTL